MRALRLVDWQQPPALVELPDPRPRPGEVVVRMGAAGACHSDLHLLHDVPPGILPWQPPFTLGHENAGWVHELGDGVVGLSVGEPVVVYGAWGCGSCARCRTTSENYCERGVDAPVARGGGGLGLDGGMADLLLVPSARHLVPIPSGLDVVAAAPLADAALTPYHAVRRSLGKLLPGSTAVVVGCGGLGHLAVQILTAMTAARVVAVDVRPDALTLAEAAGAALTVSGADSAQQIREATGGVGADVVLDFVGNTDTMTLAASVSRTLGDVTVVGLAGGAYPLSIATIPYEVSMQTTYWGSRSELLEVLDLAARGAIRAHVTTYPLSAAAAAYDDLAAGRVTGRAVVVPD
jgi:propanol-preferring alcohol dehydrogenase